MEKIKTISLLCVVLACVAPAMAVDFYELYGGASWGTNYLGFNYNANPDSTAVQAFNDNYVVPFSAWVPAPYYESQGASAVPNDGTANLRQNMITARAEFVAGNNVNVNILGVADSYWPLNYGAFSTTYTYQEVRQTGGTVSANTLQIGHDVTEFAIPNGVVIANKGKYNLRGGSASLGDVRMLNESKIVTYYANYGLNDYSINNEDSPTNTMSVTMNNIYLNETMLLLGMNGGKWTINGDFGLQNEGEGNCVMLLSGDRTADRSTVLVNSAELTIKWSTLLDAIDKGFLWTNTGTRASKFRNGSYFSHVDGVGTLPTLDEIADCHFITRANLYQELSIVDLGNGMVSAVVAVPEPATLTLIGLGAIAAFRRKR